MYCQHILIFDNQTNFKTHRESAVTSEFTCVCGCVTFGRYRKYSMALYDKLDMMFTHVQIYNSTEVHQRGISGVQVSGRTRDTDITVGQARLCFAGPVLHQS